MAHVRLDPEYECFALDSLLPKEYDSKIGETCYAQKLSVEMVERYISSHFLHVNDRRTIRENV